MDRVGARGDPGIAKPRRIGLFGGSFDPPHAGHVALARAALARLPLDAVWVMPVGRPVHRRLSGRADAAIRLAWLRAIFAGASRIRVLDREARSEQPAPTIETLRWLRAERPDVSPVLLLGADAFVAMPDWVEYPAHVRLCDVAVFARAGVPLPRLEGWREVPTEALRAPGAGRVTYVAGALPDVSATMIRELAARGEHLEGRVPECVRKDIERAYAARERT